MIKCEICGKEFKNYVGLVGHFTKTHKISSKDYFIKYLNDNQIPTCYCGKETKFINLKEGFRTYCSMSCLNKSEEHKEKVKQTCQEKFGVDFSTQSKIVQEKYKQTCRDKFGTDNPFQNEEVKEKCKQTCQNKFGVDNPFGNKEVKQKIKETNNERFGCDNPLLENKEIIEKAKKTRLKTNTENAKNTFLEMGFEIISDYKHNRFLTTFRCNECKAFFKEKPFNLYKREHKCPACDPFIKSKLEKEISEEIQNYLFNKFNEQFYILRNDRTIIDPYEIDILVPELKLSIEINGDYWHSLEGVPERDAWKSETLITKGFKHIIIKESDWNKDKSEVLNKLNTVLELDFETYSTTRSIFTGF